MIRGMEGSDPPPPGSDVQIRTFLIADVRGYTLFTQLHGDEMAAKLAARFAEIAEEVVESRGGTLLELRGDEAMCVFVSPRDAIRAAVELQRRFVDETLAEPELPFTVGIGIDAGEAVRVGDGYRGGALNLAARLCGKAEAGEILGSREVTHLARAVEGVQYVDRGEMSFKNLTEPVAVVRIVDAEVDPRIALRPFASKPPAAKRKRWPIAVAAVAVLALVAVAIPLLSSNDDAPIVLPSNTLARLDASDGSGSDTTVALEERPGTTAVGFGSVWVTEPDRNRVIRISTETGAVIDTIPVEASPTGIAIGDDAVWVSRGPDGTIGRIDVDTNTVSQSFDAGSSPSGIAFGDGALWVADTVGATLLRIDTTSGEARSVELAGLPTAVASTPDGVWVTVPPSGVARIDGEDPSLTLDVEVGDGPSAIAHAFGSIWVANKLDGTVTRLDPSTGKTLATVAVGEGPTSLVAAGGRLWVANAYDSSITSIDPETNERDATTPVGSEAASIASDGDALWLAVGGSETEGRGGTLTVSTDQRSDTIDPAKVYGTLGWNLLSMTNDGLLGYQKVGGIEGTTLVPDLATSLPEISPDGMTYRFVLRDDVMYETGDAVRPEDVRRGIERSIVMSFPAFQHFGAIVGAAPCREARDGCDLSEGIEVDGSSLTFHLTRPDADFPFKLALAFAFAVPEDTPFENLRLEPVPATGPYRVTSATDEAITLERNPAFDEWSPAAQPDGFADSIVFRVETNLTAAYASIASGDTDVMAEPPDPADLASATATNPDRVLAAPAASTYFIGFDVVKPPFDDERLRQALAFAIDREHLVELFGGTALFRVTCQVFPATFQGYVPYCPFTGDPGTGTWNAPDLDRARTLVASAGPIDEPVTVWTTTEGGPPGAVDVMRYVTEVLDELGFRAELEILDDAGAYFGGVYPPARAGTPERPNVFISGWSADYPGAADFLANQFGCGSGGNPMGFCDEEIDRRIQDAQALQVEDVGAANRAWAALDHDLVDTGAQIPFSTGVGTYVLSDRVRNAQINPQWGLLFSRMWVE
jgi:ABC-type transport system substrate-binding protein/class 3 adenylate cyclase